MVTAKLGEPTWYEILHRNSCVSLCEEMTTEYRTGGLLLLLPLSAVVVEMHKGQTLVLKKMESLLNL